MWKVILSVLDACFTPDPEFPSEEELLPISDKQNFVNIRTTTAAIQSINDVACTYQTTNDETPNLPVDYYQCGSGENSYSAIVNHNQDGLGTNMLRVESDTPVTKVNGNPITSVTQTQITASTK